MRSSRALCSLFGIVPNVTNAVIVASMSGSSPFFFLPPRPFQEGLQHNCVLCTWRRHVKGSLTTPLPFPSSISLTESSLFLFYRPKKAQHFPARKVVRLPQDPPRSGFCVFCTFACSAVLPLTLPTLLHPPHLCLHALSPTNCSFSRLTLVFPSLF
jgi:hypothetical protein